MSKISAFLKTKKSTKKADVAEPAPEAAKVETAVAGKEEWTKDVVDVEIVPVAVRKVDGASDFEDEEIELPSSMVKLNFEWGRSAEERKTNEAKQQADSSTEQTKVPESGLASVFKMKSRKKITDDWLPIEAAGAAVKSTPAAVAPTVQEVKAPAKKRKERRNKQFLLSSAKEGDDKIMTLSSKDIWAVIEPWQRPTFLQSSA